MYSNFDFIKEENRDLYILGKSIESQVESAPSAVLCEATTFLDNILYSIYEKENLPVDVTTFGERCEKLGTHKAISDSFKVFLQKTYEIRNKMHSELTTGAESYLKGNKKRARSILKRLFRATCFYYEYLGYRDATPDYVPVSDLDKQFLEVDKCIICGKPTEFDSFYCEDCGKVKDYCDHLNYFQEKHGYHSLFSAQVISTLGYSKEELDKLLPELVAKNFLSKVNGCYVVNCEEHKQLQETVKQYEEVESLFKKFYLGKLNIFQLRDTKTYNEGKMFKEPFVEFYEFVKKEFMKKFFKECQSDKTLKEIHKSNLISNEEFIALIKENESPLLLLKLKDEFLEYRKKEVPKETIMADLLIDDEIYERLEIKLDDELSAISIQDNFYKDLLNGKYYGDALKDNNLTSSDVHDFINKNPDFENKMGIIMNRRRNQLMRSLNNNGLKTALDDAKITEIQLNEEFGEKTINEINEILKEKYYQQIGHGDTNKQAIEICEVSESWVNRWMEEPEFKSKIENIKASNLMRFLQEGKELDEALESADIADDETKNNILSRVEFTPLIKDNKSVLANNELKSAFKHYKLLNCSEDEIKGVLFLEDDAYYHLDSILSSEIVEDRKSKYIECLQNDCSYEDALNETGLTFDEIIDLKKEDNDFKQILNDIFNKRQELLLDSLEENGFKSSVKISGITENQLGYLFNAKNYNPFYNKLNNSLKAKYLDLVSNEMSSDDALEICEVDETWLNNWMADLAFKDKLNKISENSLLKLLKEGKDLEEALKQTGFSKKQFNSFVKKGFNKIEKYEEFFQIYSEKIFLNDFNKFLNKFSNHDEKTALKKAGIDKNIFLFELERNEQFFKTYLDAKKCKYVKIAISKNHNSALKSSGLTEEEFLDNEIALNKTVKKAKMDMLLYEIKVNNRNPYQALKQINLDINDVYRMYVTGIYGGEYEKFANEFECAYIDPIMRKVDLIMELEESSANNALRIIKNDGKSSKLSEAGRTERNKRNKKRRESLNRSKKSNSKNNGSSFINWDLSLSKKDYKLWKKYQILDSYSYRSVIVESVSIPDMATC